MTRLFLDRETWCELDLKEVGTYLYAEQAEDLLISYALDDEPVKVWDVTADPFCPEDLHDALLHADEVWAWNAQFDAAIHDGPAQSGLPRVELSRWRCAMAQALSHALPGKLSEACTVLKVPEDQAKHKEGKKLINLFTKPLPKNRKLRRATRLTHPAEWERFKLYAANDIEAMRECVRRMPRWNWDDACIREWHLDQVINRRGFYVDRELTRAGIRAAESEIARLRERFREITKGVVDRPSQRQQFMDYMNERFDLGLVDTTKDTFTQLIKEGGLDPEAKELMELCMAANRTSTAKYAALDPAVQADGRFRGGLQFAGAGRTRRWAGRKFQGQNLPARGLPPPEMVESYIEHLKNGTHDLMFNDLMRYGAAALRGVVIAPPGKKLAVADLSNIEGRKLSWFAQEHWKLKAFRDYDAGTGPDLYKITAASILGGSPYDVSKENRNVFGKVPDLACLGPDTQVLTKRGLVTIVEVLSTDVLWDGIEWVNHEGLKDNGVRPVVNVDGIEATPDHLINTRGTWRQARDIVSPGSMLPLALETGLDSLRSLISSADLPAAFEGLLSPATAGHKHTPCCSATCRMERAPDAMSAQSSKPAAHENTTGVTSASARMKSTGGGCSTESQRPSTAAEIPTTKPTPTMAAGASACGRSGNATEHYSCSICSRCPDGTTQSLSSTERRSTSATSPATCASSPAEKIGTTSAVCRRCSAESPNSKRVYDLVNAGPRHRFLVKSNSGWLLVHNSGYQGGVAGYQTFAHTYGVRMSDHWGTIQASIEPHIIEKAWANLEKWGRPQLETLEIDEIEWVASETCKLKWRSRHPATVEFWYALQRAAQDAIRSPGMTFSVGPFLKVKCVGFLDQRWLVVRLPSGRFLTYFEPHLIDDTICYWGEASEEGKTSRAWVRCFTHGGKLTGNCLGKNTLVVTQSGAKRIVDVTVADKVWDGVEWVHHQGLAHQGVKEVGTWLGVQITPNHLIHDGNSWRPAMQLDARFSHDALSSARSSALSPSFAVTSQTAALQTVCASAAPPAESTCGSCGASKAYAAGNAQTQSYAHVCGETKTSSPTTSCDSLGLIGTNTWSVDAPCLLTPHTPTTAGEESPSTRHGLLTAGCSTNTHEPCPGGTKVGLISIAKTTSEGTNPETCDSSLVAPMPTTNAQTGTSSTETRNGPSLSSGVAIAQLGDPPIVSANTSTKAKHLNGSWAGTTESTEVFDLMDCGPRHRFMILTDAGPVIVHNCCQTSARDVIAQAMQRAEDAHYFPVLSVHDEVIAEVDDTPEFNAQGLIDILAYQEPWTEGLPLAAAGFTTMRYHKD